MRSAGLWRHLGSILVLPGTATLIVPALLFCLTPSRLIARIPAWARFVSLGVGSGLIVAGLALVVATILLFAHIGKGTLAPWDPTQRLVVRGPFRFVRNPMITGVASVLLGEAALSLRTALFIWFALFALANAIYIPLSEEPGLIRRFVDDYAVYKRNVPRWIPRLRPWTPPAPQPPKEPPPAAP